jgi:hypothetical protein
MPIRREPICPCLADYRAVELCVLFGFISGGDIYCKQGHILCSSLVVPVTVAQVQYGSHGSGKPHLSRDIDMRPNEKLSIRSGLRI